ncbi:MAG TPA: histidinol dehydrogenase, partial [Nitrososphaeraceae archaeon]|nr:histidinol dehydrogenase [Nitrososphaeraceae archaeon]
MKRITIKNAKLDVDRVRYSISSNFSEDAIKKTGEIIENVRKYGDDAIKKYTSIYDKVELDSFKVNNEEIEEAYNCISDDHIKTIKLIRDRLIKNETILLEHLKEISYLYPQSENLQRTFQPISST